MHSGGYFSTNYQFPSCGSPSIYNGEFSGEKIAGTGVTSALLKRNGIQVMSEEGIQEFSGNSRVFFIEKLCKVCEMLSNKVS
ncbi:MAG TPA: DUF523 domain-containing protein [Bacillales bacterium]|nr:DUF523 domain-containing protein [Bacillales bacterium]